MNTVPYHFFISFKIIDFPWQESEDHETEEIPAKIRRMDKAHGLPPSAG